jgi:hypothetical protein
MMTSTLDADAKKLLRSIAEAKRAAITLHEADDDDLPGEVGDFVLLSPDGQMTAVTSAFMQRAALTFFAAERFQPNKPPPKISQRDLPRAKKLVNAMRAALKAKRADDPTVIPPPQWRDFIGAAP